MTNKKCSDADERVKGDIEAEPDELRTWRLLSEQIEPLAQALLDERQRNWDGYSEDTRAFFESRGVHRPELPPHLVALARQAAGVIDAALLTADDAMLVRMLEAIDPKAGKQRARRGVVEVFRKALHMQPGGKIGPHAERLAVLFLLDHLPAYHGKFRDLKEQDLERLLKTGRLAAGGGRRRGKTGAILLAGEASVYCNAFGDGERTPEGARDEFKDAIRKLKP